jgi:hypothetical protein
MNSRFRSACCYVAERNGEAALAIADGATEAYEARRWADLLTASFIDGCITPDPHAVGSWLNSAQQTWKNTRRTEFTSVFDEERALTSPAFCTFLGTTVSAPDQRGCRTWRAVAIGDCIAVHTRAGRRIITFPSMSSTDFGYEPNVVSTDPSHASRALADAVYSGGTLTPGDQLMFATDAFGKWALSSDEAGVSPWTVISTLVNDGFENLIRAARASGEMPDDDVTVAVIRVPTTQ